MIGILELPAILMLGIQCVIRYPEAHKRVAAAQVENHSLNLKVLIDCFFSNILKWRGQASAFSKVVRRSRTTLKSGTALAVPGMPPL